jgi:hypothetical protein
MQVLCSGVKGLGGKSWAGCGGLRPVMVTPTEKDLNHDNKSVDSEGKFDQIRPNPACLAAAKLAAKRHKERKSSCGCAFYTNFWLWPRVVFIRLDQTKSSQIKPLKGDRAALRGGYPSRKSRRTAARSKPVRLSQTIGLEHGARPHPDLLALGEGKAGGALGLADVLAGTAVRLSQTRSNPLLADSPKSCTASKRGSRRQDTNGGGRDDGAPKKSQRIRVSKSVPRL